MRDNAEKTSFEKFSLTIRYTPSDKKKNKTQAIAKQPIVKGFFSSKVSR